MRPIYMQFFLLNFLSIVATAQGKQLYNPFIDVQHYEFAVSLNDSNDEIKAEATVTVLFMKATTSVNLDLSNKNEKGKGMTVATVNENEKSLEFSHTANVLKIKLNQPGKAGDTKTYKISYKGIPADGLVFSKNKFKQRTIFADNWPNRAHNWLPCVDHLSDKASVDFLVTSPDHYKVISNGILVEESALDDHRKFTHWKETVALPTKVMVIGLADFAVNYTGNVDCIPVSAWVFPQDKMNGFYDYGQAMEILPFFIKQVGPYAYKKLANVEAITIFGGMENAGTIFYNERSITGKRISEELMAHEIAHQWFGNSATESDWPHVWLSEGFATEMTHLYLENKYGPDTLTARLKADRKTVIDFAKIRFTPIVDNSEIDNYLDLLNDNSYKKAAWVLHMLRRKLGDEVFWKGIRAYYAAYAGRNAYTDDFRKVMEEASQIDLTDFFQQWLYMPGHPVLQINWKYDDSNKALLLEIGQLQKQLFTFPLEFNFLGRNSSTLNKTILINDKITRMEVPLDARPTQVLADPSTNLLFEGKVTEEN